MSLILNGDTGISGVDGSSSTPAVQGNDTNTGMFFPTADTIAFAEGGTEVMRIDSSGNVGIGTASPTAKLSVQTAGGATNGIDIYSPSTTNGARLKFSDNNYSAAIQSVPAGGTTSLAFEVAGSERMRIDSSGNVGIGTASPNGKFESYANSGYSIIANSSAGSVAINPSSNAILFGTSNVSAYATGNYDAAVHVYKISGTERMRLSSAGGLSVGTTSDPGVGAIYATGNITAFFSDIRLKNNEGRIDNALDKVSKLSGIYYTTNETAKEYGYTDEARQVGVIAQEVKEVLPEIVKAAPFDLDENGKSKSGQDYMTVQYDKLVPLLIEAIKELSEKVAKLEGK